MYDLILKGGTVVDGTGNPRFTADVAVKDGVIVKVGDVTGEASEIIDATGLIVSSGFIDWHSHSDLAVLADLDAFNIIEQGITTEISGHCGVSVAPYSDVPGNAVNAFTKPEQAERMAQQGGSFRSFLDELKRQELPTNMAFFIGHGNLRAAVMGFAGRKPTPEEYDKMKALLRECMEEGAMGMSTGLIYPPGSYSTTEELIELAKVTGEYEGAIYATHMRSEGNGSIASVHEALTIGEQAGVAVDISHHKIGGRHNKGLSRETLRLIAEANQQGRKVGLDQYPYDGGATALISSLPPKYAVDGLEAVREKLRDPAVRAEVREALSHDSNEFENLIYGSTVEGVLVAPVPGHPELNGKSVAEIAKVLGKDPYDTIMDLIIEGGQEVGAVYRMISEWDIDNIMRFPLTMIGIDGAHATEKNALDHPRTLATYPKLLGEFCRDKGVLTLEQMIRRMTGLAADFANFPRKGYVREGMDADLVVFDFATINGKAGYGSADVDNEGIHYVFVNGVKALENGKRLPTRSGKVLLRNGK